MFCLLIFELSQVTRAHARDEIRSTSAKLETAASVAFTEGPAYHVDGSVYFSESVTDRIMRFVPSTQGVSADMVAETFRQPSGLANGLAFDQQGRLLACEGAGRGGNRRVTRTEPDGKITVLADSYMGKRLNSPNDLDIDVQGRIYFTDPRYGDRSGMEMDKEGVYRIDPSGRLVRVIDDLERPNGIAVSPDQKTLYVIDNNPTLRGSRKIHAFTLEPDGSIANRRVIYDFRTSRGGDGMCLDSRGNLYIAAGLNTPAPPAEGGPAKGGIYVISPAGKQIDFIAIPEDAVTNSTFGDPDLKTLYITAGKTLFRIRLSVRGHLLWPPAKNQP
jgi:gluconolactonase